MATSEVAKVVAQAPAVNWWVVVASSAVIASIVNGVVLGLVKRGDRKREDEASAKRRSLAYRDAAYALEAFAKEANAYCSAIDHALPEYYRHNMQAFDALDDVHLRFDLPPETVVSELSAECVDQLREFRERLHQSSAWVAGQDDWAHRDDVYEFEMQRAIYFGSEACRLADTIRAEVGIEPYPMTAQYLAAFDAQFDWLARQYATRRFELIPELEPRMKERHPHLPAAESEADL
ncbi:hypothetical protein [Burkholderia sp. WTPI3]|uniref:hypothetical protein n=1 Tax=Burkholderia sp. WTPI3 TaxID=2822167 RepID=UPI001F1C00EB|nr:hypothetical protein [Burkholderia sp. WTPI3]